MIYSEVFNTHKGIVSHQKQSICEIHKQIYDLLVLNLQDRPELLKKIIPLLETAFAQGISVVHKLVEYKLTSNLRIKSRLPNTSKEAINLRKERVRLVALEKQLRETKELLGQKTNYV